MARISTTAAWKSGVMAARNGEPLDANPYDPQSGLFESWNDGWRLDATLEKYETPQK